MNEFAYRVDVKLTIECLKQLLPLADAATNLVLVGDLSQFRAWDLDGLTVEEIPVADAIFQESHGRLSIPLSGVNKFALKKEVLPLIGIRTRIQDVYLERYGRLLFSAPDYFNNGATLSDWFAHDFVQELEAEGVIRVTQAAPRARTVIRRPASYSGFAFG